jgi:hypothetical protein
VASNCVCHGETAVAQCTLAVAHESDALRVAREPRGGVAAQRERERELPTRRRLCDRESLLEPERAVGVPLADTARSAASVGDAVASGAWRYAVELDERGAVAYPAEAEPDVCCSCADGHAGAREAAAEAIGGARRAQGAGAGADAIARAVGAERGGDRALRLYRETQQALAGEALVVCCGGPGRAGAKDARERSCAKRERHRERHEESDCRGLRLMCREPQRPAGSQREASRRSALDRNVPRATLRPKHRPSLIAISPVPPPAPSPPTRH